MPDQSAHDNPSRNEHVILPEIESLVSVQVAPNSVCLLRSRAAEGHHLQLDADAKGIVRFHATPSKLGEAIELDLECRVDGGQTTRHQVTLRAGMRPTPAVNPGMPSGTSRPPLEGDLLALPNNELIARGYPPRPDGAEYPARYARWYRKVSKPFTSVQPTKVPHPGVRFSRSQGPERARLRADLPPRLQSPTLPLPPPVVRAMFNANSDSWSGAYLTNPVGQFFWIQADWLVPGVFGLPGAPIYSAAAEWIGLDNSGTDLYQAGSDSECWVFPSGWTITSYWMWIQSLPFAPWGIPNFPLSPGDEVSVDIFVADQNGTTWFQNGENGGLTEADNTVWFMIYNYTQGLSFWGTLPTASETLGGEASSGFTGSTAEFIMERPADSNNNPYPLAPFGIVSMHNCWYGDSEYGSRAWQLGPDGSTPFDATPTYINMQNSLDNNLLAISFSPGGSPISWAWVNWF